MVIKFNVHGNKKQLLCAKYWSDDVTTDIVYGGSKGSSKSYTGCALIVGDALMYPNTHYFIARKKLADLTKYTIPSIYEVMEHYEIPPSTYKYNGQSNIFHFHNGSKIFLIEAKYMPSDPMFARLGSMQMTRGWIEEAGEFEVEAKNNLMATVGRWNNEKYGIRGKVLQTCNPAKNYLYKDYYKKNLVNELPEHQKFIQALPSDNKKIDAGYLKHLNNVLSHNEKKRLLEGNWEYDNDPTALCDYDNIISLFENDHVKDGKKYITADIARMGSDKSIILVWSGWRVIEFACVERSKVTVVQNIINGFRLKHGISKKDCLADEDGVGGGVVDNSGIEGFVNNSRALNDGNYANLQHQCVYGLAEKIQDNEIWFSAELSEKDKEEIIEELEQIKTFNQDQEGKLRTLPKVEIKQLIGRSPDWRDALMMRKWFDLRPTSKAPKSRLMMRN